MTFAELCERLRQRENFTFVRYGDGEWRCLLGHKGHNHDRHAFDPDLGLRLRQILIARPDYVLGMQAHAMRLWGEGITEFLHAYELRLEWTDADVLHKASLRGQLEQFFEALRGRTVILVGPRRNRAIGKIDYHGFVEVPDVCCWRDGGATVKAVAQLLDGLPAELAAAGAVVLVCGSIAANAWIDELYRTHGRVHTFLDLGSVLEPYLGRMSRSYHKRLDPKNLVGGKRAASYRDVPGGCDERLYAEAGARLRPGAAVVELRPGLGRSTAFLAELCASAHKPVRLTVVSDFAATNPALPDPRDLFLGYLEALGLRETVSVLVRGTLDGAACFTDKSLAFVHLGRADGEALLEALDAFVPKVEPGGLIAGGCLAPADLAQVSHRLSGCDVRGDSWCKELR